MLFEKSDKLAKAFLATALSCLLLGLLFGLLGGIQYILPSWMKDSFPFSRLRPLHVSLVITWIFTAASGGIYYYLPRIVGQPLYSLRCGWLHFYILLVSIFLIATGYFLGIFGGREYLEFPPWIGLVILAYWTFFMINFFGTVRKFKEKWPVYLWM